MSVCTNAFTAQKKFFFQKTKLTFAATTALADHADTLAERTSPEQAVDEELDQPAADHEKKSMFSLFAHFIYICD